MNVHRQHQKHVSRVLVQGSTNRAIGGGLAWGAQGSPLLECDVVELQWMDLVKSSVVIVSWVRWHVNDSVCIDQYHASDGSQFQ